MAAVGVLAERIAPAFGADPETLVAAAYLLDFRTFPWESGGSATRARSARAGMAVAGGVVCAGVGVSR